MAGRPPVYSSPAARRQARLESKRNSRLKHADSERAKARERYYRNKEKTEQAAKHGRLRRRSQKNAPAQASATSHPHPTPHGMSTLEVQVRAPTALQVTIATLWRRVYADGEAGNDTEVMAARAEEIIRAVREVGWESYESIQADQLQCIKDLGEQAQGVFEEALRRDPTCQSAECRDALRLKNRLSRLEISEDEVGIWMRSGPDDYEQLYRQGKLVWQGITM